MGQTLGRGYHRRPQSFRNDWQSAYLWNAKLQYAELGAADLRDVCLFEAGTDWGSFWDAVWRATFETQCWTMRGLLSELRECSIARSIFSSCSLR